MAYDPRSTRARLLRAAIREFSAYGLAGGRVDRIADSAQVNKRAIYDYFGSKQALFEAAVQWVADDLIESVALRDGELADYAGELFDYLRANPDAPRLLGWRRLERPAVAPQLAEGFDAQLRTIRTSGALDPVDLAILVVGLANAWDLTGPDLVAAGGEDPTDADRIAGHRAAVIEAARRLQSPG